MYDRPKGNFSYLIAFAKQLAQALDSHRDDDVGFACESIHASLGLLGFVCGDGAGADDGAIPEGVDDDDAPGDDTPLGAALRRIADLESGTPRDVVVTGQRRLVGGGSTTSKGGDMGARRERRNAPILKGGKRRAKK